MTTTPQTDTTAAYLTRGMKVRITAKRSRFYGRIGTVIRTDGRTVQATFEDETVDEWKGRASWFLKGEWEAAS